MYKCSESIRYQEKGKQVEWEDEYDHGIEATEAAEPTIRGEGDDRNVNRHRQNEGVRNNGSGHSVANGDNAPNVEGKSFLLIELCG